MKWTKRRKNRARIIQTTIEEIKKYLEEKKKND